MNNTGTEFRSLMRAHHPKMIASVTDVHTKALLDLPQMLIKLAAQISQIDVVSGLQQKFTSFSGGVQ